jgi:hypothetical protein
MDRQTAAAKLQDVDLVPVLEGKVAAAKELERQLLDRDVPVVLAAKPKGECCSGHCACGGKVQLLVREEDVVRVQQLLAHEWVESVKREGLGGEARLAAPVAGVDPPPPEALACPACGCAAPLIAGACSDCGLQLDDLAAGDDAS